MVTYNVFFFLILIYFKILRRDRLYRRGKYHKKRCLEMDCRTVKRLAYLSIKAQIQNLPRIGGVKIQEGTSEVLGKVQHLPD
jgi:hypothetical protein